MCTRRANAGDERWGTDLFRFGIPGWRGEGLRDRKKERRVSEFEMTCLRRGRECLRIIYGPEYTRAEHLISLRQQALGGLESEPVDPRP